MKELRDAVAQQSQKVQVQNHVFWDDVQIMMCRSCRTNTHFLIQIMYFEVIEPLPKKNRFHQPNCEFIPKQDRIYANLWRCWWEHGIPTAIRYIVGHLMEFISNKMVWVCTIIVDTPKYPTDEPIWDASPCAVGRSYFNVYNWMFHGKVWMRTKWYMLFWSLPRIYPSSPILWGVT